MSLNQTRPRRSAGGRPGWLAITVLVIAALTFVIPIAVNFYTDFQWFGEVDYRGVFATTWLTRIVLFVIVGLITGALTFLSMWLAWRSRPVDLGLTDPRSPQAVYRRMAESGLSW